MRNAESPARDQLVFEKMPSWGRRFSSPFFEPELV